VHNYTIQNIPPQKGLTAKIVRFRPYIDAVGRLNMLNPEVWP